VRVLAEPVPRSAAEPLRRSTAEEPAAGLRRGSCGQLSLYPEVVMAMAPIQPAPSFLATTIEFARDRLRVGEWDIRWDSWAFATKQPETVWLADLPQFIAQFRSAFAWLYPTKLQIWSLDHQETLDWTPVVGALDDWSAHLPQDALTLGCELELDGLLHWVGPDQTVACSVFPGVSRFMITLDETSVWATFTLWPNLFTDWVYVYQRDPSNPYGVLPRHEVPFLPAARDNRDQLAASLRRWEALAQAPIVEWWTESLDGVERYGIPGDARPW
jgi:hypothetical protein